MAILPLGRFRDKVVSGLSSANAPANKFGAFLIGKPLHTLSGNALVDLTQFMRTVEGEGWNLDVKTAAIGGFHSIPADHQSGWRR